MSDETANEAVLLLSYAMSASGAAWQAGDAEQQRYARALALQLPTPHRLDPICFRYPFLIGALDLVSRLLYPRSLLQRKLTIALTLVECHTCSANWLLPRDRSPLQLLLALVRIGLRVLAKLGFGILLLLCFRGFLRRNVGPI